MLHTPCYRLVCPACNKGLFNCHCTEYDERMLDEEYVSAYMSVATLHKGTRYQMGNEAAEEIRSGRWRHAFIDSSAYHLICTSMVPFVNSYLVLLRLELSDYIVVPDGIQVIYRPEDVLSSEVVMNGVL